MIIELLVILLAWIGLSLVIQGAFGVSILVALPVTLACLLLYDYITAGEQTDNQRG